MKSGEPMKSFESRDWKIKNKWKYLIESFGNREIVQCERSSGGNSKLTMGFSRKNLNMECSGRAQYDSPVSQPRWAFGNGSILSF